MNAPERIALPARLPESALDPPFRQADPLLLATPAGVAGHARSARRTCALGPTSANTSPARFVFLTTAAAKERLLPALSPGNVDKTRAAPAVAVVAYDARFYEQLPTRFPQADARSWFAGNQPLIDATAFRNRSLQGGYLMLAARSLGLDCGPMSGFDADAVNVEFFPDGNWKVNFPCNLGYGDPGQAVPAQSTAALRRGVSRSLSAPTAA